MYLANSPTRYGAVAKTLHWLIALGVFTMIPLGLIASDMADRLLTADPFPGEAFVQRTVILFSLHKTLGIAILFTALLRIAWVLAQPRPGLLNADRPVEAFVARTVHWSLYGALLAVPLSGWLHHAATSGFAPIWWPLGQGLPLVPRDERLAALFSNLHMVALRVLFAALLLHVAGALKHHLIDRDATLRRMLPGRIDTPVPPQPGGLIPFVAALALWALTLGIAAALALAPPRADPPDLAPPIPAQSWTVTDGAIDIAVSQLGNRITGRFANWSAAIQFQERAAPGAAGAVQVDIGIASLDLGSVTDQAMGPDFFDEESYPLAIFQGLITLTDTGYVASGPLTLRGRSRMIELPFHVDLIGDTATMSASLILDRRDFDIGTLVAEPATLGHQVTVTIALTAARAVE